MPRSMDEQRERRREKYCRYKDLCDQLGVPRQGQRWDSHYAELRREHGEVVRRSPDETLVRLTRDQIIAWWRERFTDDELRQMGAYLDYTLREGVGFGF